MQSLDVHWLTRRLADVPDHNNWLSDREREVLAGLTVIKRRSDWRLGRWTAKCLVRAQLDRRFGIHEYGDIEVRAAPDGAPDVYVRGEVAPVTLSISHSNGVALCALAVCEMRLGCDTELIEARTEAFVADYFSSEERGVVARMPIWHRPLAATLIWSAKESVLKARRVGLRHDTRSVVVDVGDSVRCRRDQWTRFSARCTDDGGAFGGFWMSAAGHVHTLATEPRVSAQSI